MSALATMRSTLPRRLTSWMKINMQIRFPQQSLSFRRQCLLLPAFFMFLKIK